MRIPCTTADMVGRHVPLRHEQTTVATTHPTLTLMTRQFCVYRRHPWYSSKRTIQMELCSCPRVWSTRRTYACGTKCCGSTTCHMRRRFRHGTLRPTPPTCQVSDALCYKHQKITVAKSLTRYQTRYPDI